MNEYPGVVSTVVEDYIQRMRLRLNSVPSREREDFVREIQSHIYEAYQQEPGDDLVVRILTVLRKLGEPAEVVADRLPNAIVRSGSRRRSPLHIAGAILLGVFGVPLGFAGVAVMLGVFGALAGVVIAYYAAASSVILAGAIFALMGLIRSYQPELWNLLVSHGVIRLDGPPGEIFDALSPASQGTALILLACIFVAFGVTMFWLGRFLIRGMRFLMRLGFDQIRHVTGKARQKIRRPSVPASQSENIPLRAV